MRVWASFAVLFLLAVASAFGGGGECGNEIVEGGEDCDLGAGNGQTDCGCTVDCTWTSAGISCGDPTATECDLADQCDGQGFCDAHFAEAGTFCGDSLGDECNNPDTCSDSGQCLSNLVEDGTLCTSDTQFCTGVEICFSGGCTSPGDPCDPGQVCKEANDQCQAGLLLDFDGDGEIQPLTDGLLFLRYLFGFRGNVLVTGAVDTVNCNRCTAVAIEGYLGDLL